MASNRNSHSQSNQNRTTMILTKTIVRVASLYNASALVFFIVPGGLSLLGIQEPYSSFWRVLPGLLASYGAIVLWLSSVDILKYASFSFWNGVIRLIFAASALALNYGVTVGPFIFLLVFGDIILGVLTLVSVKRASDRSLRQLITNSN